MRASDVTDCHVLVVGSGGAGVRAAIEASRYGETVLVSKSLTGKGGCTTMAEGGYNAVLRCEDDTEDHYTDTMKGGAYLNDPDLVRILVRESPLRIADLIRWGAVFDMTEGDEVAQRPFGGQCFPRTCFAGDRTGHEMMKTLTEHLACTDVKAVEEVMVISLLTDGNAVTGAAGLDRDGRLVVFQADAVVLATGGGTRVYDISTNSGTGSGDGFALGYRAGAELIDMEQIQFHPTGAVHPWDARGRLVTEAVRGEGGVLTNTAGERFMSRYDPVKKELSTRDVVARAIATEILEGRGTPRGGVYLDVTHLPAHQIEERLPVMLEQFLNFGVDIRKEPMEVAPTAHHIMGGLRITPEGRTSIPGLFACGEVAGGVHGANRLGGNALADTQVFGKRAGETAGREPRRSRVNSGSQADALESKLSRFLDGDANPVGVRTRLQEAMWEGAGIFRTAEGLSATRETIRKLSSLPLKASSPAGFALCCTVENMCLSASLIVRAALLRRESRGAHVRRDITQTWDALTSPFGHTCLSLDHEGIEIRRGVPT